MLRISKETFDSMTGPEFKSYLEGSGMPEGVKYSVTPAADNTVVVSWGSDINTTVVSWGSDINTTVQHVEQADTSVNFSKMTKEELETYAIKEFDVNLNTSMKKVDMIAKIMELSNG